MLSRTGHMPRLSIVIPAADAALLEDTLVSVLENRPSDCEIIAVLAVPYADPWSIGEEIRFVQAPVGATLVDLVNLGVASSAAEIVHVLAAGWRATEGWAEAALGRFAEPGVTAVVPVTVAADDRGRVVAAGIRRTSGGRSLPNLAMRGTSQIDRRTAGDVSASAPSLEAGFWRRDAFPQRGFSKVCGDRMAAADMAAAVASAGGVVAVESVCRVVEGPGSQRESSFLEGLHAERLFWRSLAGESFLPALVAHAGEVIRHAVAVAPMGTLPMLAGRLTSLMQFGSCLGRARELKALRVAAEARLGVVTDDVGRATLRIDSGHPLLSRPRGGNDAVVGAEEHSLRRSA